MYIFEDIPRTPCWTSWAIVKRQASETSSSAEPPPSLVSALHREDRSPASSTMPARWPDTRTQEIATGETAMNKTSYSVLPTSPINRIKCWLANVLAARATLRELNAAGAAETGRIAGDLSMSAQDLRALAKRGPDSTGLLDARLLQLGVNRVEDALDPAIVRDLQRICTMCEDRRRCAKDLAARDASESWREYCPNVPTLEALQVLQPMQK